MSDASKPDSGSGGGSGICSAAMRPYAIGFAVFGVVALAVGLGLGLGLKKSGARTLFDIPPLQPPVSASVPTALRPGDAAWVKVQSAGDAADSHPLLLALGAFGGAGAGSGFGLQAVTVNSSLTAIQKRVFGPGPTDFVSRLGAIDQRLQEFRTRSREGDAGRACLAEAPQQWTPNFLPAGETFPMWFSCQEAVSGDLRVYFGTRADVSYVAEVQWPTSGPAPKMAVLATVTNNGTRVRAWQIISEMSGNSPTEVSYLQINADRTQKEVEVRDTGLKWFIVLRPIWFLWVGLFSYSHPAFFLRVCGALVIHALRSTAMALAIAMTLFRFRLPRPRPTTGTLAAACACAPRARRRSSMRSAILPIRPWQAARRARLVPC
jgi:hypothetical protein